MTNHGKFPPPVSTPRQLGGIIVMGLLLALLAGQAFFSMRDKAVTTDEMMYIAAGYYHLRTGDFQLNMTNTPLVKVIVGFPLLFLNPDLPAIEDNPRDWSIIKQWEYSREFLYENSIDADRILLTARLPIVFLALVLGFYVYRFSNELYGGRAGLFSLFLYSFSPNIIAHARIASQDLGLTAFMFIATFYFWRYMKAAKWSSLFLCGVFTGCALLAKTTAIFLGPIFGAFVLYCIVTRNGLGIDGKAPGVAHLERGGVARKQVATALFSFSVIGVLTLLVLNIGYGFQGSFRPLPLPEPFLIMLRNQAGTVASLGDVYFAGKIHSDGLWYLIPASFLFKTPLPLIILLLTSLWLAALRWRTLGGTFLLLAFGGIIGFVFSFIVMGIGLRYILPIYPVLHVLIGSLWQVRWKMPRVTGGVALLLSIWYLMATISVYPHYLSYFNEFVGGPKNGYKYLSDSNVDWGQDLKGLAKYMKDSGLKKVRLGYFGSADANYYGIEYDYLPSVGLEPRESSELWWYEMEEPAPEIELSPGVYAISASLIASSGWMNDKYFEAYVNFRDREPDDMVGYSILIFKID